MESKNKVLRPPFSFRVSNTDNLSVHAHRVPTTNGALSLPKDAAGIVPQDPSQNSPLKPPTNSPASISQHFTANDNQRPLTGEVQPQLKGTPVAGSSSESVSLGNLPTISRDKNHRVFLVTEDIERYLKRDLDHTRLNKIHQHLWMAGRPLNARPIHRLKMMGYDILLTEQADLHLLKFSNKFFIKPLPDYMLCSMFWDKYLCESEELHKSACQKLNLLPCDITWTWWKSFVAEFLSHIDANTLNQVNKRYHFGELRLGRINSIYRIRFFSTHFIRGYLYGYNRYAVFFQRNFAWILIVLVYFSLVLSAMQVGATVPPLNTNHAFQQASYGFAVFSIVTVAAVVCFVGVLFAATFLINMVLAISHEKMKRRDRDILAQESEGTAKA